MVTWVLKTIHVVLGPGYVVLKGLWSFGSADPLVSVILCILEDQVVTWSCGPKGLVDHTCGVVVVKSLWF